MWCQVPQKFPAGEQNNNTKNSIYQLFQCARHPAPHFAQRISVLSIVLRGRYYHCSHFTKEEKNETPTC